MGRKSSVYSYYELHLSILSATKVATRMMSGGFVLNFCTTLVLTVVALIRVYGTYGYALSRIRLTPSRWHRVQLNHCNVYTHNNDSFIDCSLGCARE